MRGLLLSSFLALAVLGHPRGDRATKYSGFQHGAAQRPPFFDKVSREAREEYVDNRFDVEKTKHQILEDEREWGRANGLEEEVHEQQAARKAFYNGHAERMAEAFEELPEAFVKMRAYFKNYSLSRTERERALHRFFKAMTPELRSLMHASRAVNIEKFARTELFPSHKRMEEIKENLVSDHY